MLLGAPGYRLNARLEPALELAGDTVIRFHGSSLSSDSSYFADLRLPFYQAIESRYTELSEPASATRVPRFAVPSS